jgi:hypothetical protein
MKPSARHSLTRRAAAGRSREEIIKEVQSNTVEEMEQNVESITQWVSQQRR